MESLPFIDWCLSNLDNYWVIMLLMAIESSFIPFPSEIVVPPAAYNNADHPIRIVLIVLAATAGAIIGALVNYGLAYFLGRPVVYKFANSRLGHMCLLNQEKVEKAEAYFEKHGALGTLVGRLVPAVRQLISIPAGLSRMALGKFVMYTTIGAALWNTVLATLGWYLHRVVKPEDLEAAVQKYNGELKWAMIALGVAVVAYLVYQGCKKTPEQTDESKTEAE